MNHFPYKLWFALGCAFSTYPLIEGIEQAGPWIVLPCLGIVLNLFFLTYVHLHEHRLSKSEKERK